MALTKEIRGGGSTGSLPPEYGGGGGDPSGGNRPNYAERLKRARMGLAVGLTPVAMLFVSFSAAFVARRLFASAELSVSPQYEKWVSTPLPWMLLLINTVVLLASSACIEMARHSATRRVALAPVRSIPGVSLGNDRNFPWLGFTVVLGSCFLLGQWRAWLLLRNHGVFISTAPSSSFFYLLTGMHALHLGGGILALLYAVIAALRRWEIERQRIIIEVAAWYWHFMMVLWIFILLLVLVTT